MRLSPVGRRLPRAVPWWKLATFVAALVPQVTAVTLDPAVLTFTIPNPTVTLGGLAITLDPAVLTFVIPNPTVTAAVADTQPTRRRWARMTQRNRG